MTDPNPDPDLCPVPVGRKPRHDTFDGKRRRAFLEALGKCGCVRDAARRAGVSPQTVYTHQARDRQFARQCDLALRKASTDLELHAFERGVLGVEVPIVHRGEVVGTRLHRSDAILRLLLQGAKPNKYGANPGVGRRQLHRLARQRIEREVRDDLRERALLAAPAASDTADAILAKLDALDRAQDRQRRAAGYVLVGEDWIPPGWVRADAAALTVADRDAATDGAEQTPDSV